VVSTRAPRVDGLGSHWNVPSQPRHATGNGHVGPLPVSEIAIARGRKAAREGSPVTLSGTPDRGRGSASVNRYEFQCHTPGRWQSALLFHYLGDWTWRVSSRRQRTSVNVQEYLLRRSRGIERAPSVPGTYPWPQRPGHRRGRDRAQSPQRSPVLRGHLPRLGKAAGPEDVRTISRRPSPTPCSGTTSSSVNPARRATPLEATWSGSV
jgi:hypothetical protein